ncbi:hypothetical protein K4K59_000317 [Colletotrichum sp. SAR11_240]|nr:hypothetical protein K4K59_000317 [Colletotrichum sp. SAR11_240]
MSRRTTVWFGRSSPTSRQPHTTSSSSHVELAVVFKDIATYRPYTPGTGPPLRPITLVPVRDSTAYIRDEFFVPPPLSQDGKKRLQYVVGWSDLPAARLVVDAERVADYVSPAAYEDWCAARAAERDEEERRREEEENVRAVAEAEARERGMLVLRNGVKDTPRKDVVTGKRKRRTKAEMAAARAETPVEGDGKRKPGRPKKSAPSLSTPSKARLEEFRELETEVEGDRDELSDVYEVLRLEGLQIRHVRGKPVRYFAVRWKGNWPPDQNPTWEPESNIPRYMTKKYLLNNPTPVKGKNGNGTLDKYLSPGWSQRKYSSVSEAFEGGDPEVAAAQEVQDEEAMEDEEEEEVEGDGEGDEMLVVTDEPPPRVQPTLSW